MLKENRKMEEDQSNQSTQVTINNIKYNIDDLSLNAKQQLAGLQLAVDEMRRLNRLIALAETAKYAYGLALESDLPEPAAED